MHETRFDGTIYIDGSKTGCAAQIEIMAGSLRVVTTDGAVLDIPVRGTRYEKGGYNDGQLVVTGQADQGTPLVLYVTPIRKVVTALLAAGA